MREIKFRAWDSKDKVMLYPKDLALLPTNIVISPQGEGFLQIDCRCLAEGIIPHYEPLQYLEFKDTKGKEIYDGDIIKYFLPPIDAHGHSDEDNSIEYIEKIGFVDGVPCVNANIPLYVVMDMYPEVVGNIYENPDLIKE